MVKYQRSGLNQETVVKTQICSLDGDHTFQLLMYLRQFWEMDQI